MSDKYYIHHINIVCIMSYWLLFKLIEDYFTDIPLMGAINEWSFITAWQKYVTQING